MSSPSLTSLPPQLARVLQGWPRLAAVQLDAVILTQTGALAQVQEVETQITQYLYHLRQVQTELVQKQQRGEVMTEQQQKLAQEQSETYKVLYVILQQVIEKKRMIEDVFTRAAANATSSTPIHPVYNTVIHTAAMTPSTPSAYPYSLNNDARQRSNFDMTDPTSPQATHSSFHPQYPVQAQVQVQPQAQASTAVSLPPINAHTMNNSQRMTVSPQPSARVIFQPHAPSSPQPQPQQTHLPQHMYGATQTQQVQSPTLSSSSSTVSLPSVHPHLANHSSTGASSSSSSSSSLFGEIQILPPERRRHPGDRYRFIKFLRDSLFGRVELFYDAQSKREVAIKLSNKKAVSSRTSLKGTKIAENPLDELHFMRILSRHRIIEGQPLIHPGQKHVLQVLDECEDANDLWTVMEYCSLGEFFDIVVSEKHFSEAKAKKYFLQLCHGVAYMHAHLICHLDLSLENLLMDSNGDLKICDFGLARVMKLDQDKHISPFEGIQKNKPGKLGYMAPELFQGEHFYGHLCDIWCIGIILFTSLTGVPPFPMPVKTDGRFQLIYTGRISELLKAWNMTDRIPPLCLDLLTHILCPAAKRYNIQQVLAHPWLKQ